MNTTEKVPKSIEPKFAAIVRLTDAFCEQRLNEEYRQLIHRLLGALARKRPSPLTQGKEASWAAGAVHAIGFANFLGDASQTPHCKPKIIYDFFGIAESTGQSKSKEIRNLLKIDQLSPQWTLPSRLADNPMVWMLQINGLIIDVRRAPIELQRQAFEMGLIPFVPAERNGRDG
ncbi:MAG TPA: DUF6398 domain-containing protein [Rhodocyclaceae bacterium]|nr:DUF6398 domain-containing protein [Rhodocyclaceae bacterium]